LGQRIHGKYHLPKSRDPFFIMASYFLRKNDRIFLKSINYCVYCGSDENLVIDHIFPRNKGGSNNLDNLTRACNKCNLYKSDFTIEEFLNRNKEKRKKSFNTVIHCISIIYKYKEKNTPIISKFQDIFIRLKKERQNHSYYSKVIGNIIKQNYKLL